MTPLHTLEDHIVPGLQGQVQIGHQARFLAHTAQEVGIDLGRIDGGEAKARQVGHQLQDAGHQLTKGGLAGQVTAPRGDIDAGQNHFVIALGGQTADLFDHLARRGRARIAPPKGDDAEGAAMVAAILHLDIGPRPLLEPIDQVASRFPHRHDVIDPNAGSVGGGDGIGPGLSLLGIAEHQINLLHRPKGGGVDLGGAACDDQAGAWPLAAHLANGLARLAYGLAGHCAGVEDHRITQTILSRALADHFGLIGIETAAKGHHLDILVLIEGGGEG